jgi:hypothetical protein
MENGQEPVNQSGLKRIRDFTDLETWRFARRLRVEVYRISQGFPRNETFALASQIRRAAVSVTANIAEGFGALLLSGEYSVLPPEPRFCL